MSVNEIAIISGKGGTGKTTLTAAIIPFLKNVVIADADVDAPDLNILIEGKLTETRDFIGFQRPRIDYDKCIMCGKCFRSCNFNAITEDIVIKDGKCEGCTVCEYVCPVNAITMHDYVIGNLYTRDTIYGPMVDARLIPGEESSGKLVSEVRKIALEEAARVNADNIIIDGSPGIACNVISGITGVNKVVIVTEPSLSGLHDLKKVLKLVRSFDLEVVVVINKYDLSEDLSKLINEYCIEEKVQVLMEIPFDERMVTTISDKIIPSLGDIPFFKGDQWKNFIKYLTL